MLPITHTLAATKVLGIEYLKENSLAVMGTSIPDIHIFGGTMTYEDLHRKDLEFLEYVKSKDKKYVPLAIGMMLHGETPRGLDYYSHFVFDNKRPGYAFRQSKPLIGMIKDLYKMQTPLKDDEIAHMFIEYGVELVVIKNYPEIVELINDTIYSKKFNNMMLEDIANFLSSAECFSGGIDRQDIADYYKIFNPKKFSSFEKAIKTYTEMTAKGLMNMPDKAVGGIIPDILISSASEKLNDVIENFVDINLLKKIVAESVKISKPTYKEFISKSTKSMKLEIDKLGIM